MLGRIMKGFPKTRFLRILGATCLILLTVIPGHTLVKLNPDKFVVHFHNLPSNERICQRSPTKGIYTPMNPGWAEGFYKCCRGRLLLDSFWVLNTAPSDQLPNFTECDLNVTTQNERDDFATLVWKIHACKVKSVSGGKPESDIHFEAYVQIRTTNYTMVDNLKHLIVDNSIKKGCPGADAETIFHKKIEKYYWCFQKNEKNFCQEPATPEARRILSLSLNQTRILNDQTNASCPLVPVGTDLASHCCNGTSTPTPWSDRLWRMLEQPVPITKLANGSLLVKKPYYACMRTSFLLLNNLNLTTNSGNGTNFTTKFVKGTNLTTKSVNGTSRIPLRNGGCLKACILNPVTFSDDGSSKPDVDFESSFDSVVEKYLPWFNTAGKNAMRNMVTKTKKGFLIPTRIKEKQSKTKFDKADEAFKKLSSPLEKVTLYCAYYQALDNLLHSGSSAVCKR